MSSITGIPRKVNIAAGGYFCRAKYGFDREGNRILLSAEWASRPIFGRLSNDVGEDEEGGGVKWDPDADENEVSDKSDNIRRAVNRAKVRAFDFIMCNPDLDAFATLTVDPERCDRTDWAAIYKPLREWLTNRVTRKGLKYILCPEYHKDGEAIHAHMLCNSSALAYEAARTPGGRLCYRKGKPVYNLTDWRLGFSTMQTIPAGDSREAVAKYVFKYMGKQAGEMIGGRYFLHGGDLRAPHYEYADELAALPGVDAGQATFRTNFHPTSGMEYSKLYYL